MIGPAAPSRAVAIPCVAAITDLAALRFWACRGIDLHLVTKAESIPEVRAIAGAHDRDPPRARAQPSALRRRRAPLASHARGTLDLPAMIPVAVVSGSGWAVGDLAGETEAVLAADPRALVADPVRDEPVAPARARRRVAAEPACARWASPTVCPTSSPPRTC